MFFEKVLFLLFSISAINCGFLNIQSIPFVESTAKEFWFYQVAALCSSERLQSWNVSEVSDLYPNITDIQVFSNNSNLAYVAYNPDEDLIWMVFRRTVNIENMIEDIDILQIEYENCLDCQVHGGFFGAYLNVRDSVMEAFKEIQEKHQSAKIAVIGHSLGAAMSTFAFVDVSKLFGKVDYFYTFGSPRVGNEQFSKYVDNLDKNCNKARITHYQDATPHLPFVFMGYYHVGNEVFYNEDSTRYLVCKQEEEDETCSMQFGVLELSTADHVNYMGFDHEIYQKTCQ